MHQEAAVSIYIIFFSFGSSLKFILSKDCGEMNRQAMDKRIVGGIPAEAGEFPWQVDSECLMFDIL